jgi:hypothetical protein
VGGECTSIEKYTTLDKTLLQSKRIEKVGFCPRP